MMDCCQICAQPAAFGPER